MLHDIFLLFGTPHVLQSDNGREFVNDVLTEYLKIAGTDKRTVAAWNPAANGLAESGVKIVKTTLRKMVAGSFGRWPSALRGAVFDVNARQSGAHKSVPFSLFFGRALNPRIPKGFGDALDKVVLPDAHVVNSIADRKQLLEEVVRPVIDRKLIERARKQNIKLDGKRMKAPKIEEKSVVFLVNQHATSKVDPRYVGPYVVHRVNRRGTLSLRDMYTNELLPRSVPVQQVKPVGDPDLPLFDAHGEIITEGARYVIDDIVGHKGDGSVGNTLYHVRWKGGDHTWEPADSFDSAETLANYWRRKQR